MLAGWFGFLGWVIMDLCFVCEWWIVWVVFLCCLLILVLWWSIVVL